MPYPDTRHRLIDLLKQLGVAALYASLIYIEHSHFESDAVIGSFEPASGLALAALLIFGKRYAGCVFLGALLANAMQAPFMEAAAISSGDTLQALCGAWLLTRNAGFDRAIRSLNDYLRLISLGGCVSVGIGALITMTALLLSGFTAPETYYRELLGWWMGDMLGVILITPMILVWWQAEKGWLETKWLIEAALLLGLTFLAGQIIFLGWFHDSIGQVAKGYAMFLFITWVAVRLGARGTVIAVNMVAVQGLLGAHHGTGYFANDIAESQLVNYWLYTLALSVVGMALTTFISGQKRSEEALRQSELKFRTLYDSTSDAVMLLDEKGFFDCNKATLEMIGCATKEEFCTKHPADLSPPEQPCGTSSLMLANRHIATAMKEGSCRFEWTSRRLDTGKIFIADVLLSAIELEGRPVVQAVIRDITEQKHTEEELQRFFDLVPDMVCIASTDGRFQKINRAWQTTLGYTEQEILSTPFLDFIHPDDRGATMQEVAKQIAGEATIRFINRYRCKDGSYKWLEWDATPAVDKTLLFASARDITESKRIKSILAESENRFREIFNAVSDAIFIHDAETGQIIDVNHRMCEMYGFTREEALACDVSDLSAGVSPYSTADAIEKIHLARTTGSQTFDWLARARDGHLFWVEVSLRFADIGNQQRILAMVRDITDRKATEQQLHDLSAHILDIREQEKSRIAREIHDELGGTLTSLKIDAYWLLRKLPANEETTPFIERAKSMSQRIDNAINTTRHIIDNMRPTILDDLGLLAAIEWQAAEFCKNTGIECTVSCIEDEANLDNQRSIALFRVLQEALTNVSRHSGASRVEIEFRHRENEVILMIGDNGCGIPKNHMAISKPYDSKSYGILGMTERVNQLGGKIIFSSPQGGGFSVEVVLPLPAGERSTR